jgi:hypothetical protein
MPKLLYCCARVLNPDPNISIASDGRIPENVFQNDKTVLEVAVAGAN